jgi:hypothetical protein
MDRSPRLAELVVHLTDCAPQDAVAAVAAATAAAPHEVADPLAIVARAMRSLRRVDLTTPVDLRDPREVPVR